MNCHGEMQRLPGDCRPPRNRRDSNLALTMTLLALAAIVAALVVGGGK